jgi:hypothetical protein
MRAATTLLISLFLQFVAVPAWAATTYYVDSFAGSDANDGQSPRSPWLTLNQVNITTFHAGDRLLFVRGGMWLGQLWPRGSWDHVTPIQIDAYAGSYGTAAPVINAGGRRFAPMPIEHGDTCVLNGNADCAAGFGYPAGSAPPGTCQEYVIENLHHLLCSTCTSSSQCSDGQTCEPSGMCSYPNPTASPPMTTGSQGSVYLQDQSGWEIRNLHVLNCDPDTTMCTSMPDTDAGRGTLVGIQVLNTTTPSQQAEHIYIGGNTIDHVASNRGYIYTLATQNAGIAVAADMYNGLGDSFTDVTVEDNVVHDVGTTGLVVWPWMLNDGNFDCFSAHAGQTADPGEFSACTGRRPIVASPSTNILFHNNTLYNIYGGAMSVLVTDHVTIEHNLIHDSLAGHVGDTDVQVGAGPGITTYGSSNITTQYNEIANLAAGGDDFAIDYDFATINHTIQYNYSHHNPGGFVETFEEHNPSPQCGNTTDAFNCYVYGSGEIIRWNISIDDGSPDSAVFYFNHYPYGQFLFGGPLDGQGDYPPLIASNTLPTVIVNNSILSDGTVARPIIAMYKDPTVEGTPTLQVNGRTWGDQCPAADGNPTACGLRFHNNIIYTANGGNSSWWTTSGALFTYNTYYGTFSSLPNQSDCTAPMCPSPATDKYRDPMLLAPWVGGSTPPAGRTDATGTALANGSPEIGSGYHDAFISPLIGYLDFWGHVVPSSGPINRGADNGSAVAVTVDPASGWLMPANAAEWSTLLSGTGIAAPSHLYLAQDSSGNLADSIGTAPMTVAGSGLTYQDSVSGWSRKGVKWTDDLSTYFCNGVSTNNTSAALLVVASIDATPTASRSAWYQAADVLFPAAPQFRVDDANAAYGAANPVGGVHAYLLRNSQVLRLTSMTSDQEVITPAWANVSNQTCIGGVLFPSPAMHLLYAAQWVGASADLTQGQANALIGLMTNGHSAPPVTVDQTSGWYTPANAGEWANLLQGTGIAVPSHLYLAQEASGNLVDAIGTSPFVANGTGVTYGAPVPGWSRKGLKWTDDLPAFFANGVSTSNTSAAMLILASVDEAPSGERTAWYQGAHVVLPGTAQFRVDDANSAYGAANPVGSVHAFLLQNSQALLHTSMTSDQEVITPAWANVANGTFIGGVLYGSPAMHILYVAQWVGSSADFTPSQAGTLVDLITNGHS